MDFNTVYFLYKGEIITEEKYNSTFDNFASKIDNQANTASIIVYDVDPLSSKNTLKSNNNINDDIIVNSINLRENILERVIDPQILEQRNFYFYFLTILLIQYTCIVLFSWLGFYLDFNKYLIKDNNIIIIEVIPVIIVLIIMAVIAKEVSKKYSKSAYLIIYQVFSALFTIYFSYLLSKYIEPKYIIISLSLILIELVSMEFYVLLFKNYKIIFITLMYFVLSLIGLILFSIFWIKELFPIIFISIFWILSIAYLFLHIYIILKICKLDEYFYACIIFNYGLFLLIALGLKIIYNFIKSLFYNFDNDVILQIKIYSVFIIQNIIIISFAFLGFNLEWNYLVIKSWYSFKCFLIPTIIINFLISAFLLCIILAGQKKEDNLDILDYICLFLYIPFMIIFIFIVSYFIEPKYILGLLIIILLNLIAIDLFIILFKSTNICGYFLSSFIMNITTIILFHFLWLENKNAIIANSIIPFVISIIWIILSYSFNEVEDYKFGVERLNYIIFIIIYALTLALAALAIGIALGILYGIYLILKNIN